MIMILDIKKWNNYGKLINGIPYRSNLLYTPKMNKSMDILCMSWDINDPYQFENGKKREKLTNELMDYFFRKEVENIKFFKHYKWAPTILKIDEKKKQIFIEWNKETCNDILVKGYKLEEFCPDWKSQLFTIINDIINAGYYKMSLYTHCFFINKNGILKTFDYYACVDQSKPFIEVKKLDGMIGNDSEGRFKEAIIGESVNFELFFKQALKNHIKWPDNALEIFYKEQYNE